MISNTIINLSSSKNPPPNTDPASVPDNTACLATTSVTPLAHGNQFAASPFAEATPPARPSGQVRVLRSPSDEPQRPACNEPFVFEYAYRQWADSIVAPRGTTEACRDIAHLCLQIPEFVNSFSHYQMGVGATHVLRDANLTRGPHAMATADICIMIAAQTGLNADDTVALFAAGLLHDLGHVPFSHQLEQALATFEEYAENPFDHEKRTECVLDSVKIRGLLGDDLTDRVIDILHRHKEPLCALEDYADRMAYLRHDFKYAGLSGADQVDDVVMSAIGAMELYGDHLVWNNLDAVTRLIQARDRLFRSVSAGYQGALVRETVTEGVAATTKRLNCTPTELLNVIQDSSTPEMLSLLDEKYRGKLTFPRGLPGVNDSTPSTPVDLAYTPAALIKYDMLSERGRRMVYCDANIMGDTEHEHKSLMEPQLTSGVYWRERANVTGLEYQVRLALTQKFGRMYTPEHDIIVGCVEMPPKPYEIRTLDTNGHICVDKKYGEHRFELFVAVPVSMPEEERAALHKHVMGHLKKNDLLRSTPVGSSSTRWSRQDTELIAALDTPPSWDLFRRLSY